jgi:hypothetical protein
MFRRLVLALLTLVLATAGALTPAAPTRAQLEPEVRDRVTAAAVGIAIRTDTGVTYGSGTVVSASGLVLTNHHVIAEAERDGLDIWIATSDGRSSPVLAYKATVVRSDPILDLAVLQIVTDANDVPLSPEQLRLGYVELGNSDQLELGDDLHILSYPVVGQGLLYTRGVVSGLRTEPGITGTAWVFTDGAISGGSSGGTAVNANGELVAVPTGGLPQICENKDTNGDGMIDADDNCVIEGATVGLLRPVNFAKPMLTSAGLATEDDEQQRSSVDLLTPPIQRVEDDRTPTATATPTHTPAPTHSPTSVPPLTSTPTPIPIPPITPTPTPSPIPIRTVIPVENQPPLPLSPLLPNTLILSPGQSFRLYATGPESLETITAKYGNPGMVQQALRSLGWVEAEHRIFAADNVPANATGWTELHIHRFATTLGASDALPLLAWEHQKMTDARPIDLGVFADESMALAGPAFNGNEVTIIARRGNLLVRATGITPRGDPTSDVIEAILVPLGPIATDVRVVTPELLQILPSPDTLPSGLVQTEERARSAGNTASTFSNPDETSRLFVEWGWLESASGVYEGMTPRGTTRFEALVYRWRDADGASAALSYFVRNRADALQLAELTPPTIGDETRAIMGPVTGGTEATIYVRIDNYVLRMTAIGSGDPMADVLTLFGGP